ncbi:UDP-N-acetylmuramoyl-tripeptide--D-alanyl-D-alanine ligase [Kineosporia sp. A_224]|uniref:UDP-N-acetylmuramoyl-tripeptide--D-alanyl-D- alanine ligase n=1 Tax=Kineosporia sp. A_224 TaxID=1962180 RepID=UPI000B4B79E0|nr:UDP-N-acetylmuramoyl-tripeptide--D-alanyl-D-alanine ligase [Kineosporia sp. A_224]
MIPLTLAEVAAATGGRLVDGAAPDAVVTGGVVIDSRAVTAGDLFVAFPGERVDGHDYAPGAVAAGAVTVLATRSTGVPAVLVDDAQTALGLLARAVVDRLPDLTVVALTGSSGKTSTKDLLGVLLARLGPTVAPVGSFNNEIGHPLTALRCDTGTRYLVAEMGARMPGNIAYLCGITPPRVALALNVGTSHLGIFGSREVIARTKGEIVEALAPDGVAVLNADDPLVAAMASRTTARVVTFGRAPGADVRAQDVRLDAAARPRFRLSAAGGSADVALALHGEHHVANALAAAAVAIELGLPVADAAQALSGATAASRWRMEVHERADGVTVVNDAYNANPDSVRAALEALVAMGRGDAVGARRTWAVLGEMKELGDDSAAEHETAGRLAVRLGVSRLVAVGDPAAPYAQGAAAAGAPDGAAVGVPDADAALDLLRDALQPGDVVLVKASRSVGLDRLATRLLETPVTVGGGVADGGSSAPGVPVPPVAVAAGEDVEDRAGRKEGNAP